MKKKYTRESTDGKIEIFCRYIVRKGKKVFPPKGQKAWHFLGNAQTCCVMKKKG